MDDLIRRRSVLEGLASIAKAKAKSDAQKAMMGRTMFFVERLPSVSTEKIGRWITQWNPAHQKEYYYCSECREEYSYDGETGIKMNNYKFCPNCGVKMEVEDG